MMRIFTDTPRADSLSFLHYISSRFQGTACGILQRAICISKKIQGSLMLWLASWSSHSVQHIKQAWICIRLALAISPFVAQSAADCLEKNLGIELAAFSLHKAVSLPKSKWFGSYTTYQKSFIGTSNTRFTQHRLSKSTRTRKEYELFPCETFLLRNSSVPHQNWEPSTSVTSNCPSNLQK